MKLIPIQFLIPRIKINLNPDEFSSGRVGAYCIRPTDGHTGGRMNLIPIRFLIPRIKTNQKPAHSSIHLTIVMVIFGAYAIRPYTDDQNLVHFSVHSIIVMVICGAYAIRPYTDT